MPLFYIVLRPLHSDRDVTSFIGRVPQILNYAWHGRSSESCFIVPFEVSWLVMPAAASRTVFIVPFEVSWLVIPAGRSRKGFLYCAFWGIVTCNGGRLGEGTGTNSVKKERNTREILKKEIKFLLDVNPWSTNQQRHVLFLFISILLLFMS